jgi:hypothetical protein
VGRLRLPLWRPAKKYKTLHPYRGTLR